MTLPLPSDRPLSGRFTLEREIGRGAVGVVYRAIDQTSQRPVALKILASEAGVAPEDEERLQREGDVLKGLSHPGIVRIVDAGVVDDTGQPYVAMEWLEGEDLVARQRREPLTLVEVVCLGSLVARALGAAHDAGVVHRDIKPANILLCAGAPDDPELAELGVTPVLVDFGVAASRDLHTTRAGDIVGTPAYMAPEQARGGQIDERADLYSLGATLFELITGRPPHVGPNAIATLARLVTTEAPRLSELRREVPPALDDLVKCLLATDPAQRPSSAREVERLLVDALEGCRRMTWNPEGLARRGSGMTRLVTTLVALHFGTPSSRERALEQLTSRSADVAPLGLDALVAHWGARRAVGNEASTALDLARRLARAGAQVGIASGRARVEFGSEHGGAQPLGEVVDRASALARDAAQGTVLVDATTSELGRGRYELRVRDDGSAIVGDQMRGANADRVGGAPFLGREPEMAQVLRAYERALDESTPVLVSVTGPPGIGKSRLRREMLARVSARAESPLVILQRSESYARAHALGAAADVLRAIVELSKGATIAEAERAIENRRLGAATRTELSRETRLLLARLLANEPIEEGLAERGARDALWLGMTDLVHGVVSSSSSVVIVMEDLQWADPESVGWVDHMLGRAGQKPLLVLACVRPSFWPEHGQRFAGRDHVRLELRPISKRASRGIAAALLGEAAGEDVLERIAEQAAGSPLFAEELSRLAAAGRDPTGAPTIEAAIQVSLDTLDEECRDAVGRLSVLGLTCWDTALEALGVERPEGVMRALAANEVLVQQLTSRYPGASEWNFKHALVRDVAYQALGEEERRELHARAASWLASMGDDATTVAGHYDLGERHDLASDYWERAAHRALSANALSDAMSMAERALSFSNDKSAGFRRASYLDEAWSRLDPRASDRESALQLLEENVHDEASAVRARGARARFDDARGAGQDISERLAEARDEAERLGLTDEVARCSATLAARAAFAGRVERAETEARRLLQMSREHGIKSAAVDAYQTQAIIRQSRGALSLALEARRNAAGAARAAGLKEREAMLTTNLGFALTTIGARQEARGALETGLALAEAIGSLGAVRHAQMNLLGWAAVFGNDKRLEAHLSEVRADADAAASGIWAAPDRSNLGMLFYRGVELLRVKDGRSNLRAVSLLRMAASNYRHTGHHDLLPVALGMWAEGERLCKNLEGAVRLSREAVDLLQAGAPSLLNESPVYLTLHDALVDAGDLDGAREAIARGMPALMRRLHGLVGTAYARQFLTELPANTALVAVAERFGLVPDDIHALLAQDSN